MQAMSIFSLGEIRRGRRRPAGAEAVSPGAASPNTHNPAPA
jgi:hypothetical protein